MALGGESNLRAWIDRLVSRGASAVLQVVLRVM